MNTPETKESWKGIDLEAEKWFNAFTKEAQKVAFLQIDNKELKEFLNTKDEVIKKEVALNDELIEALKYAMANAIWSGETYARFEKLVTKK